MPGSYQITIACLAIILTSSSVEAMDLTARGTMKVAGTSEPPGPGCPSIPGGPGPPPDDDDDEDVALG